MATETGITEINECQTPYFIQDRDGHKIKVVCGHGATRHVASETYSEAGKRIPQRCLIPDCPCEKLQGTTKDNVESYL